MGIQGLWDELSPAAQKISLVKLATDKWETTNGDQCLKVAIDTSIWSFQIQSGKNGSNPALRTFYYRLCRLLKLNINPIFVFEGSQKPPFKRNLPAKSGQHFETKALKVLIHAFGFVTWDSPGEAEAECALLQKCGVVDLVITEDVDALMFGAEKVAREIPEKNRSHVWLYENVEKRIGLDKDGLVLVAMMSGGDYLPAGVPKCGPKIAVEAARAGFATKLMNTTDYASWREELAAALTINPDQTFSRRHPALAKQLLNTSFPDTTILKYYTHPVVSSSEKLATFKPVWKKPDIPTLAKLCRNLFAWEFQWGMVRLMKSIAPGLVLWDIVHQTNKDDMSRTQDKPSSSVVPSKTKKSSTRVSEGKTITDYFKPTKSISLPPTKPMPPTSKDSWILGFHGTRKHCSTDNTEELRLSYIPSTIQPYTHLNFNLTAPPIPTQSAPKTPSKRTNTSDTSKSESSGESEDDIPGPWAPKWSPDEIARIWIPKVYVQKAVPARLEEWERSEIVRKTPKKKRVGREIGVEQMGAMDQFVRRLGKEQRPTDECLVRGVKVAKSMQSSGKKTPRKENVNPATIGNTRKGVYSTPKKDMNDICSTSKKNTGEIYSIPTKNNMVTTAWTLSSSDSDSDPLPSPTSLLTYVPTPKTQRTKRRLEQVSPLSSRNGGIVDTVGKNLRNERFRKDDIVVEKVLAVGGRVLGGFRESLGGTWHEVSNE